MDATKLMLKATRFCQLIATVLVLLAALPSGSGDLVLCLGTDGHAHVLGVTAHEDVATTGHDDACETSSGVAASTCLDFVLCSRYDTFRMDRPAELQLVRAALPQSDHCLPVPPAPPTELSPRDLTQSLWLHQVRSIILII